MSYGDLIVSILADRITELLKTRKNDSEIFKKLMVTS